MQPTILGRSRPPKQLAPDLDAFSLTVIVPVFNEVANLEPAMRSFTTAELPVPFEIVCVDDGSTDGSVDVLRRFESDQVTVIESETNGGKGNAIRKGLAHATGDYILIQDADLEYSPDDWSELIQPILRGDTDVVYGSRFLGRRTGMKFHSYVANRFLTLLTKVMFGSSITDMETCFKLIKTDVLRSLPLTANRFDFEPQVTAFLLQEGHRIVEVPITYEGRDKSEGKKIGFRDGVDAVRMLVHCFIEGRKRR